MTDAVMILHQYEISPFSEKVRVLLGIKGLAWRACEQPIINPKPDLVALTGGYRRIPVLQVGADLYCDSNLILEELERRFPSDSPVSPGDALAPLVLPWCEGELFMAVVRSLFAGDWDYDDAFLADRSALMGSVFSPDAMLAALPAAETELRRHLATLGGLLADGRPFLTGTAANAVDAMVFAQTRFIRCGRGRTARLLDAHTAIAAWEGRVRAIGHGQRGHDIDRAEAVAIARAAKPVAAVASDTGLEVQLGDRVRFRYADANSPVLEGELVRIDARSLTIARDLADGGRVHLHLPRTAGTLER